MTVLTPVVFEDLMRKMKDVVAGNLPHYFDVVAAIMRKMDMRSIGDNREFVRGNPSTIFPSRTGSSVSVQEHSGGPVEEIQRGPGKPIIFEFSEWISCLKQHLHRLLLKAERTWKKSRKI